MKHKLVENQDAIEKTFITIDPRLEKKEISAKSDGHKKNGVLRSQVRCTRMFSEFALGVVLLKNWAQ